VLVVAALAVGLIPHLGSVAQAAAVRFQDQHAYAAAVLSHQHVAHPVALYPAEAAGVTLADVLSGAGSAVAALVLAALALYWKRIPGLRRSAQPRLLLAGRIRWFQSGVVNDYVTWIVIGLAGIGAALALAVR
jgi:multicomponent Na+:H+ antiporter subunit D